MDISEKLNKSKQMFTNLCDELWSSNKETHDIIDKLILNDSTMTDCEKRNELYRNLKHRQDNNVILLKVATMVSVIVSIPVIIYMLK